MSQNLARIRNLILEIDEIQRQGQAKVRPDLAELAPSEPVPSAPAPLQVASIAPAPPVPEAHPGRVGLHLSRNVTVEVQVDAEIIQIRRLEHALEICFADGKAFHIPFKAVA